MNHLKLFALLILNVYCNNSFSQFSCGSDLDLNLVQQYDNARYQRILSLEQHTANYISLVNGGTNDARLATPNSVIIIPVVVHVIHYGESLGTGRNISDAQIQSQIDVLNEDFRRLNADRVNLPSIFLPVATDPNFEFRLACIDPNGNSTNGITRTLGGQPTYYPTSNTNPDGSINEQGTKIKFSSLGGKDPWPTNKYLNIWVCDMIGLAGYGQFPFDYATKPNTDGVVVKFDYFGRVGNLNPSSAKGRTCTHEIGHWLNLYHIFGSFALSCADDDFVNDTPTQMDPNFNCPMFPTGDCAASIQTGDMFMNYMDYTNDACKNTYTKGQGLRMRALFATGGPRSGFIGNYFSINQASQVTCTTASVNAYNPSCLPITWSIVSGPATIISGQGTNTVTIQRNGSSNGTVALRAIAGGYLDEKTIYVGSPTISTNTPIKVWFGNTATDYNNICNLQTYYTNFLVTGANSVTWTRTSASPTNTSWSQSGQNINFYFWAVGQTAVFKITATNGCGSSIISYGFKSIDCGGGGCNAYILSPNPSKSTLKIIVPNIPPPCFAKSGQTEVNFSISQIKIVDNFGNIKILRKENRSKEVSIDLSRLIDGIYFIEISNENYSERQKLILEK